MCRAFFLHRTQWGLDKIREIINDLTSAISRICSARIPFEWSIWCSTSVERCLGESQLAHKKKTEMLRKEGKTNLLFLFFLQQFKYLRFKANLSLVIKYSAVQSLYFLRNYCILYYFLGNIFIYTHSMSYLVSYIWAQVNFLML